MLSWPHKAGLLGPKRRCGRAISVMPQNHSPCAASPPPPGTGSHGERVVEREVLENFLPGAEQFSAKAAGFDAAEGVRVVSATTSRASDGVTTVIEKRITGGNWYQIKGISEPRSDLVFDGVNDAMERAANGLTVMTNKFERVAPGFAYRTAYAGRPDRITIFLKLDKGSVTKDLVDAAERAVSLSADKRRPRRSGPVRPARRCRPNCRGRRTPAFRRRPRSPVR